MQNVQTVLTSVAVTLFTVAIMWAGFKMAFGKPVMPESPVGWSGFLQFGSAHLKGIIFLLSWDTEHS